MVALLRPRRIALGLLAALIAAGAVALLLVWAERKPIARDAIDRMLAARGVPARYTIAALGPRTQRLQNIAIGDPRGPDLVAESATVTLGWRIGGPYVRAIAASGVRLRARVTADGKLSLGTIDRLLPPPGDAPFALPDVSVALSDARATIATPAGPVAVSLAGSGHLRGGFSGHVAAAASRLAREGCTLTQATAFLAIAIENREPLLDGPVRAQALDCGARGAVAAPWLAIKLRLGPALDRWTGSAGAALGAARIGGERMAGLRGTIAFAGDRRLTEGSARLTATGLALGDGTRAKAAAYAGRFATAGANLGVDGRIALRGAALGDERRCTIRDAAAAAAGTPLAPLASQAATALDAAAGDLSGEVGLAIQRRGDGTHLLLRDAKLTSASGARLTMTAGEDGLRFGPAGLDGARSDLTATLGGGGLPEARLTLAAAGGDALAGTLSIAPYRAGPATLALAPVRIRGERGAVRLDTVVTLDGPFAGGRIDGLGLPIAVGVRGGAITVNDGVCVPLTVRRLAAAGVMLAQQRVSLCPLGPALFARDGGGRQSGGLLVQHATLRGASGDAPLALTIERLGYGVAQRSLAARGIAVRLGTSDAQIRLDVARLGGASGSRGFGGDFDGAAGQIGRVPLLLDQAAGRWLIADGGLRLSGALRVRDAASAPRFRPMQGRQVALTLRDGRIDAAGMLVEPASGRAVSGVAIRHDLGTGSGAATLDVKSLTFDPRLQPEALTPLTLGLVADVAGAVNGSGRIEWGAKGVASTGSFETRGLALAAPFGPVKGLSGSLRFTDLLGLVSAPHQLVTLGEVNPGIAVADGRVRYQLLAGQVVRIEGGSWPLSGGTLTLQPSTLDFGKQAVRRFTFAVDGLDAAKFIEQFKLSDIAATGTFDGVLPMVFDASGGRIVGGHLVAREGGGRLSYVGQVSNQQLGTYGTLAFDALKSIRYQRLAIDLDGALDGEIISRIGFTGVNDRPAAAKPVKGLARSFTNLPFKFNITVRAPFRGLLNSASDFVSPGTLLNRQAVQGQESDARPSKP